MPKKRQPVQSAWKPQSTAPAALGHSGARPGGAASYNAAQGPGRGVNERLADLRRSTLGAACRSPPATVLTPSVPPSIQNILQLPKAPALASRRPLRLDANGRRLPPGPPPPRSGFLRSRVLTSAEKRAGADADATRHKHIIHVAESPGLPGSYMPAAASLADMALRRLAQSWTFQKSYQRYNLHELPSRHRAALIRYVGIWHAEGVGPADLRAVLQPPEELEDEEPGEAPAGLNDDFFYLDLNGSAGRSITVARLAKVCFPEPPAARCGVQESWDASEPLPAPIRVLPSITHLSLALVPDGGAVVSWSHLLHLAEKLPTLTHLSLAYWPVPSYTPNAVNDTVVTAQGLTARYGGAGPYSHSLYDDWFEAALILKTLSRRLYSLEYLDLTGCGGWCQALTRDHDRSENYVDWTTDWGKVTTLVIRYGFAEESRRESACGLLLTPQLVGAFATTVERNIIAMRAGKGRIIDVIKD